MKTIAIIWAGAAWLMSAATILENMEQIPRTSQWQKEDFHVHLFEKNTSPGKKVIISWWWRCNVTTGITDRKDLLSRYTRWGDFIKTAFGKFSPKKCREWFESHGVPLKCEEDMRVFPVSDDGRDIVWVFEKIFAKHHDTISLHYGEGVSGVDLLSSWTTKDLSENRTDSSYTRNDKSYKWQKLNKYSIITPKWSYEADILIITTWGNAYSHTGSSGDGYAFARALWHTVTPLGPSLSSFLTGEKWLHALSGLVLQYSRIRELSWPLLLTHFGISWPLTFKASSHMAFEIIDAKNHKTIHFAPFSDMRYPQWDTFLRSEFSSHPKKLITSILTEKLPRRFVEAFILYYFSHITTTFVGSISKADRDRISHLLGDGIPLTLLERRPGDEFVTAGWVSTDELDPETMESRFQENLYFAGEVINVDGYTWGFSLQICWASGYVAGMNVVQIINHPQ